MQELLNVAIFFALCIASFVPKNCMAATYYVTDFGARGDGHTDDTNAFIQAWKSLCGDSSGGPALVVPSGKTFLLKPVQFQGPCRSSRPRIQVLGTITGPRSLNEWIGCGGNGKFWIYFLDVNGLIIDGSGKFDGQGSLWWNNRGRTPSCDRPSALHFHNCNGLQLSGTTHLNSPREHIGVHECNTAEIGHLHISAPEGSPNTDGIDISASSHVNIHDSSIHTGDDCVAIKGGSVDVNVTGVYCGPGHGISIGSLGVYGGRDIVEQVRVINCNLSATQNGLRIKTTPGGSGYARDILFQQIQLANVKNPIIIDQHYCDGKHCGGASRVQVRSVTYRGVQGSSASPLAINFDCSESTHCTDLVMDHVSVAGSGVGASCRNAHGTFTSTSPSVTCQ